MKVKRYFASSMRSALDMIKQEQGPDVLILSNRKVDGGVELITADELTDQEAEQFAAREDAGRQRRADSEAEAASSAAPVMDAQSLFGDDQQQRELLWTDAGTVAQMREELRGLKSLLESQLSGLAWSDFGNRHPLRARLMRALSQIGIAPSLARELVAAVPDELDYRAGWHRVLALLVTRLNVMRDPILRHGGRVALTGATGVGKTTLASKLAARYAVEYGADRVAIATLDDRRLGAHQQMKSFGRLIGSAVYALRDIDELQDVFEQHDARTLILIDTPGSAPGDERHHGLISRLHDLGANIQMYNVSAASTDYLAAKHMFNLAAELPLDACILTKLDEAATLGPALSAVIESGLPLAYTTAGQRVPDDLDMVDARQLIERCVEFAKSTPVEHDRAELERAFGA